MGKRRCEYLEAPLVERKRTGLFTSPHLMTIRERICIGRMISKRQFLTVFEETLEAVRKMETDGLSHPTYFEFLFGMAMKAFDDAKMEYIILETGLGGGWMLRTALSILF